jgi:F-type H+-transporting ATPase subunit delta
MNESAITVRYSKAIYSLAHEKKIVDSLKNDMELISNVCKNSTDFILLLETPVVKTSEKSRLISKIFENKIHPLTLDFLQLIVKNNRETFIPSISRDTLDFIRREKNIKSAVLTTAIQIDQSLIEEVETLLEKELEGKVELTEKVNPDIIGGLILRIDDKQMDASVSTQLKKVKQQLLKTQV